MHSKELGKLPSTKLTVLSHELYPVCVSVCSLFVGDRLLWNFGQTDKKIHLEACFVSLFHGGYVVSPKETGCARGSKVKQVFGCTNKKGCGLRSNCAFNRICSSASARSGLGDGSILFVDFETKC